MLEKLLDDWSARSGVAVEVWALPKGDVPGLAARNVFAAVQEALTGIERHGRARTVSIAVTLSLSGLRLTVSDDGHGLADGQDDREVAVMKACFAEIGGELTVNRVPGEGSTVTGIVPARALRG
ncbi:hypothetical protein [Nonomuraea sp. NPDC050786]|uniref:sensor histidine kinase n=1 Tax=Nonomuraea sp. NPDC050786 TaxID=3154840 RepID=UPI0033C0E38E